MEAIRDEWTEQAEEMPYGSNKRENLEERIERLDAAISSMEDVESGLVG